MSYLTVGELIVLRDDIAPLLSGTAIIERQIEASDSQGGFTSTWDAVGTVAARLEPTATMMVETGGETPSSQNRWTIFTPAGTDVRETDRFVVSAHHYEVIGVRSDRTDEITCRAECIRLGTP